MLYDQILCILIPLPRPPSASEMAQLQALRPRLDAALAPTKWLHFASFALLPGRSRTELMLELVTDEDMDKADVLRRFAVLTVGLLGPFAAPADWPVLGPDASDAERFASHLMRHAKRPDGGFVGLRDLSLAQIRQEAQLSQALRDEAQKWVQSPPAPSKQTLRRYADKARARLNDPGFTWAKKPAPRSFWRRPSLSFPARVALVSVVTVVPALLLLIGLLGVLATTGVLALAAGSVTLSLQDAIVAMFAKPCTITDPCTITYAVTAGTLALMVLMLTIGALVVSRQISVSGALMAVVLLYVIVAIALLAGGAEARDALWVLIRWGAVVVLGLLVTAVALVVLVLATVTIASLISRSINWGLTRLAATALVLWGLAAWLAHELLAMVVCSGKAHVPALLAVDGVNRFGFAKVDVAAALVTLLSLLVLYATYRTWRWIARPGDVLKRLNAPKKVLLSRAQQSDPTILASELRLRGECNHMINLCDIRSPVWLNRKLLRVCLRAIAFAGHSVFTEGLLGTGRGIQFAHWHIVDRGRRLLFVSNYGGTFGGYLDEFILGASQGVNLTWRWTHLLCRNAAAPGQPDVTVPDRFPPTRLLIFAGCTNAQWFKRYARAGMVPTLYRYAAYSFAIETIQRATRLRDALSKPPSTASDDEILRALES